MRLLVIVVCGRNLAVGKWLFDALQYCSGRFPFLELTPTAK